MTITFAALSIACAPIVGIIMGYVVDHIHRAAAPRIVRLHSEDRELLYAIEARLRMARIRATLLELYAGRRHA
jgi:hypothetical protein